MGSTTSQLCIAYALCIFTAITVTACGGTRPSGEQPTAATPPQQPPPSVAPTPSPEPTPPPQPPPSEPPSSCANAPAEATRNLAAGRSYTLETAPNYTKTSEPLDTQQLTDGRNSEGVLWNDAGTVGWSNVRPVTITIDLGGVQSISEIRWRTAAGSSDVHWPAAIDVLLSSDGGTFRHVGDLVAGDSELASLPTDVYLTHTLRLAISPADARYVRLMADRDGSYVFADEIEVLGPTDTATRVIDSCTPIVRKQSDPVQDTLSAFWRVRAQRRAKLAIDRDATAIATRLASLNLAPADHQRVADQLGAATVAARDAVDATPPTSSRLPLNGAHQGMYAVAADAERLARKPAVSIWSANPWDPLDPLASPAGSEPTGLSTAVMRGERRALAFNLRSSASAPVRISLQADLPNFAPAEIRLYRVNWTGNDASRWAAAELDLLGDGGGEHAITLLPGVTQQIWVQIQPAATRPGSWRGAIAVTADVVTHQLPLDVHVYTALMPDVLSTRFGGWDYADGSSGRHAVTAVNRGQLIDYLRASHVDTPWATRRVLNWNHIGSTGAVAKAPDATALAQWLREWPNASRYRVFLSVRDAIGPIAMTDARFGAAVVAWAQSWATQIRNLGKSPEQFDLLLVDEPQSAAQAVTILAWSRAIRSSGTRFRIWIDPMWRDPQELPLDLIDAADTIAINALVARQSGSAYWNWAQGLQSEGKSMEVYSAAGPARLLDPYAYYRLAAWRAHSIGASGVTLWSFTDTRGPASDNEFAAHDYDYSPLFIAADGVRPGKQMEAAVEGLQDVEYLHLLSQASARSADASLREQAQALLESARGLALAARDEAPAWSAARDRTAAEQLRLSVGALLERIE